MRSIATDDFVVCVRLCNEPAEVLFGLETQGTLYWMEVRSPAFAICFSCTCVNVLGTADCVVHSVRSSVCFRSTLKQLCTDDEMWRGQP